MSKLLTEEELEGVILYRFWKQSCRKHCGDGVDGRHFRMDPDDVGSVLEEERRERC